MPTNEFLKRIQSIQKTFAIRTRLETRNKWNSFLNDN